MSQAYTAKQVRKKILDHMHALVKYWDEVDDQDFKSGKISAVRPCKEKLDGLAFSILNIFDGTTFEVPCIDLVMRPHPEDKEFHQAQGENWFEDGMVINADLCLHDCWHHGEKS
jgi:hypothetical protein